MKGEKSINMFSTVKKSAAAIMLVTALCLTSCSGMADMQQPEGGQSAAWQNEDQTAEITVEKPESSQKENIIQEPEEKSEEENGEKKEPASESEVDEYNEELADKHVRIRLKDSGKDVFALWGSGKPDYRYGPSIMLDEDGGIDAWFASPGDGKKEYDWITYRHSDDGGETWGDEKVVLAPTPGTADFKSVCDPDVFFYDGYYYMGYTATVNEDGLCNNVFLARSKNPDGPYEKWTGDGWGDIPVPIIYFKGVDIGWGVGEPSFVLVDDVLYIYNTLDSFSEKYGWVRATEVRSAKITDPNWPADLEYEGISVYRNDATDGSKYKYSDSDSWDVAYLEESHKFVALSTNRRFKTDSCLLYYESDDGINYERVSELNTDVVAGCHNCGLMSDGKGHIRKNDRKLIGYAYSGSEGSKWGVWSTRFAPIEIDYTDQVDREEDKADNLKMPIKIDESLLGKSPIMLLTDQLSYVTTVDDPIYISFYTMNVYRKKNAIASKDVRYEKYDRDILEINENNQIVPKREGMTIVKIEYKGLRRDICVRVIPEDCDDMRIRSFYPIARRIDIKMNEPIIVKIRPMAVFRDYDIHELTGYEMNIHNIRFRSSNESVCGVKRDGTIVPYGAGVSVITVSGDDCRYTIDVYVKEE